MQIHRASIIKVEYAFRGFECSVVRRILEDLLPQYI